MKNKYSAFLSHNSQDKSIVEKIAQWLQDNANLSVWLDKWNLIPGDPWQEEIEKALDESQCCVVFLGPKGMGPWQNMEMRSVLNTRVSENSIRVVPVLLPGAVRQKESKLPRFLRELTWVVFNVKWDESEALHGLVCGIEAKEPGRYKGDIQEDICPFRGLEIFREQDRQFFFGREVLVQRLLDKIERNRFLVVTGPSGCGKSSLVQAGLISSLRQHSQVTLFTPRERPLEELAFALRTCYPEKNKPTVEKLRKRLKEGMDILHLIAREILEYSDKKNLLIIIDQFEELFAQTKSEDERRRFISLILDAVDIPNGPVTVILTIRSDFIGKCAFYKNLNMFVNDHFVQVEPMGIEELRQAIEEPARMVGLRFEDGLANRILADVKGAPGELPLVEHALLELYEGRKGRLLLAQAYDGIGGIAGALVNRAESEFNKLDESEKEILRKMFVLRLIQPGEGTEDTRRRAAKEELLAIGGDVKVVEKILNQWINARLLTSTRDTPRQQVLIDVAHESLIRKWDRTQTWMAEGREAARLTGILRQAALEWKGANRSPDYLFQGARLLQMEGLVNTHADDLTEDEIEFVKAGVKLREAKEIEKEEQRRKELRAAQELAAAKSKAFKRARMITAIIFLFLMSVIFLAYNLNIKEKSTRKQLALNYWDNSHQAREKGQMLYFLHLCAEAMSVHPDQAFNKTLLFDMNDFWEILPLVHIFHYEEPIYGAIFNTDKTRFLTWSNNKTALQWDAKTGKQIGNTMMHRDVVKGALFNVDGRQILTWSMDGTVRLWDAKTGKPIGKALLHQDDVKGALFNPDGTQILTLIADGTALLWDAQTGKPIGPPFKHKGWVIGAKLNVDGRQILTWSRDGTSRLWDARTGKPIGKALVHKESVNGAIFNADETRILTWSDDRTARMWDARTGKPIGKALVHRESVNGAIFNSDETRILTWSDDKTARMWDAKSGKQIGESLKHKERVYEAKFIGNEDRIITLGEYGNTCLWGSKTEESNVKALEHIGEVWGAIFNSDGTRILTWSDDGTARLWDSKTGKPIGKALLHKESVNGAIFNSDETRILTWSDDGTACLWDAQNGKPIGMPMVHKESVNEAIFNSDETRILTWSRDKTARLWDAKTGKPIGMPMKHNEPFLIQIFNSDGTRLLTWSDDGTARLWDAQNGNPIGQSMSHKGDIYGAIFNSEETRILTWSRDKTARLWDAQTGKSIGQPMVHKDYVFGAIFNSEETRILTWSRDKTARLWDAQNGKPIGQPLVHENSVWGATFNVDETRILTWCYNLTEVIDFKNKSIGFLRTAHLWDAKTGEPIGKAMEHIGNSYGDIFNSDGTRILTWSDDGTARLWDARKANPSDSQ